MNIETLRTYCLSKPATEETLPFDEHTLVFKVMNKMFALTSLNIDYCRVNLKCDPEQAILWREEYPEITPGFHMSKKHWNTIMCEETLDDKFIKKMIDHSYDLIVSKLTKKLKAELASYSN